MKIETGLIIPILVLAITYLLQQWRDRIANLNKLKLDSYLEFINFLPYLGTSIGNEMDNKIAYSFNKLNFVGSKQVVKVVNELLKSILDKGKFSSDAAIKYGELYYCMRKDLKKFDKSRFKGFEFKPILLDKIIKGKESIKIPLLPDKLERLHGEELMIRMKSTLTINLNRDLKEHIEFINILINLMFYLTKTHVNRDDDELTIQYLGCRLYNAAASSLKLILSGYYQNSIMFIRDLLETGFLVEYFYIDKSKIKVWKNCSEENRKNIFSPARIRKELDKFYGDKGKKREIIYKKMCEYSTHPTYKGLNFLALGNGKLVEIGPFYDERILKSCIKELAMRFVSIVMNYNSHFKIIKNVDFLRLQGEFLIKFFKWAPKYSGMKFNQYDQRKIKNIEHLLNLIE